MFDGANLECWPLYYSILDSNMHIAQRLTSECGAIIGENYVLH